MYIKTYRRRMVRSRTTGEWYDRVKSPDVIRIDSWDTWNLNFTLAKIIAPALKAFKAECRSGYPSGVEADHAHQLDYMTRSVDLTKTNPEAEETDPGMAAWDAILDKMIFAFETLATEDDWPSVMKPCEPTYTWSEPCPDNSKGSRLMHGPMPPSGAELWTAEPRTETIDFEATQALHARIQEGIDLFAKWFAGLWD